MGAANRKAEKNTIKTLYPESSFDSVVARNALSYGNSTIEGVTFTKPKTQFGYKAPLAKRIYGANILVTLFPVTPYFTEWYNLRRAKEGKRTVCYMSDQAFRFRIETKTDDYGRFKFEKMKPGKYFLQAFLEWQNPVNYKRFVGSGYNNYGGTTDYYEWQTYYQQHKDRLEEFVEVEQDGSTVRVTLK